MKFKINQIKPNKIDWRCLIGSCCWIVIVGLGLFWFLLVMHVIASIACVISVRNGSEAFRDGATIKEAFIILYAFVVITLVLNALGLSSELMQVLRVCMLGIGSTLFIFRMLISRCFRHW